MIYVALVFLVSTLILGIMSIGAATTGSADAMANIFYLSAGLFFAFLFVDTMVRSRREKKSQAEYVRKLEEAMRGNR